MKHLTYINEYGWHWPQTGVNTQKAILQGMKVYNIAAHFLKQTNVAVQAGGNAGLMVQLFAEHFKTVYTFEPDPLNFYCLTLNVTGTNVNKFQACLGSEHTLVKLDTIFPEDCGAFFINGAGTVPTFKIDDLNLSECDLIQLDIEGQEYSALQGGLQTIKKYYPVLIVEHYSPWANRYGITDIMFDDLLTKQLNYTLVDTLDTDRVYVHSSNL